METGLVGLIMVILVIGVLVWAMNTVLAPYIDAKFLQLANVVVFVVVVLYVLFFLLGVAGVAVPWPRGR
jgi:hypothetical protein